MRYNNIPQDTTNKENHNAPKIRQNKIQNKNKTPQIRSKKMPPRDPTYKMQQKTTINYKKQ